MTVTAIENVALSPMFWRLAAHKKCRWTFEVGAFVFLVRCGMEYQEAWDEVHRHCGADAGKYFDSYNALGRFHGMYNAGREGVLWEVEKRKMDLWAEC